MTLSLSVGFVDSIGLFKHKKNLFRDNGTNKARDSINCDFSKIMTGTIQSLYHFQLGYLMKLIDNIPEDRIYEKQLEGFNSAGWILGHIYVEGQDVYKAMGIAYETDPRWVSWFENSTGKIDSLEGLPGKQALIDALVARYNDLSEIYTNLTSEERNGPHSSTLLTNELPNFDSWFAHHLTTHLSIHCGNLSVWKKMVGIPVNGY